MKNLKIIFLIFLLSTDIYSEPIIISGFENIQREGVIKDFEFISDKLYIRYTNKDDSIYSIILNPLDSKLIGDQLINAKRISFSGDRGISGAEGIVTLYDSSNKIIIIIGANIPIPFVFPGGISISISSNSLTFKLEEKWVQVKVGESKFLENGHEYYNIILKNLRPPVTAQINGVHENLEPRCDILIIFL